MVGEDHNTWVTPPVLNKRFVPLNHTSPLRKALGVVPIGIFKEAYVEVDAANVSLFPLTAVAPYMVVVLALEADPITTVVLVTDKEELGVEP